MRLSKRGEYGLRAAIHLANAQKHSPDAMVQIKDISVQEKIPTKYLEQILLALKNAGLLHYYLAKTSEKISLGQIIRALDGPLAPIRCVSHMAYEPCGCPDERTCGLRMVMGDVRNAIADILDNTTLADVTDRVDATRALLRAG